MGADGRVEVPWQIEPVSDSEELPPEAQLTGFVVFDNMTINGSIELRIDADWTDDLDVVLKLQQPTNNARLGAIKV